MLTTNADTTTRKHGLPILDVALAVGKTETDVRRLVKPVRRTGGFTRPQFLAYADKSKTKVKAIGCPHGTCAGRRYANQVAMFPEVAASRYGVICRRCRRTPNPGKDWSLTQYPTAYLDLYTARGTYGSLRQEDQTVLAVAMS